MVTNPNTPWRKFGKSTYPKNQKTYLKKINLLTSYRSKLSAQDKIFLDNLIKEVDFAVEQGYSLTSGVKCFRTRYDRVLSILKRLEVL